MDVLLMQPRIAHARRIRSGLGGFIPPMMLLYLAKPLIDKGFDVDILDLTVYHIDAERFKDYVETYRPSIAGITCTTMAFSNALRSAEYIKRVDPGIKVVMGGPHVTFKAKETLENDCIDFVVRGEGDTVFTGLVEHLLRGKGSLQTIKGISYRDNGTIVENPMTTIKDLDSLKYPQRDLRFLTRYSVPGALQSSRGCPFRCQFCSAAAMAGGKYRLRSPKSIMEEIDYLVLHVGVNYIAFLDDTLTGFPDLTEKICLHIIGKNYPLKWMCESRVDIVNRDLLKLMARAGCISIQFGFESGSPDVLESIKKNISLEEMENAVRLCVGTGINATGNFMIGFPNDTRKTIAETVSVAKKMKKLGAQVGIAVLTPFPGTYFYEHADELGITIHTKDWDEYDLENPIISTGNLDLEELRWIYYDSKLDLHYNM